MKRRDLLIALIVGLFALAAKSPAYAVVPPSSSAAGVWLGINPFADIPSEQASICSLESLYNENKGNWPDWWKSHFDGVVFFISWSDIANYAANPAPTYTFSGGPITCSDHNVVTTGLNGLLGSGSVPGLIPQGVHIGFALVAGAQTPAQGLLSPPGVQVQPNSGSTLVDSMYFTAFPPPNQLCLLEPMPWEGNFISAYKNTLKAIKSDLGSLTEGSSSRLNDLALIQLTGINESSGELIMSQGGPTRTVKPPFCKDAVCYCDGTHTYKFMLGTTQESVTPGITSGDATWAAEGYSSTLIQSAFNSIAGFARNLFGGQSYTFAIAEVNGTSQGPNGIGGVALDPSGSPVPNQISDPDFTRYLVGGVVGQVGSSSPTIAAGKLAMSYQGMSPCEPAPDPTNSVTSALCTKYQNDSFSGPTTQINCEAADGTPLNGMVYNSTALAWQTNEQVAGGGQTNCGQDAQGVSPGCNGPDYRTMLENAIDNGARYIEVWATDVKNFYNVNGVDYVSAIHDYWVKNGAAQGTTCIGTTNMARTRRR